MSDLRQQLQALTARWRNSKTYPADSSERAAWVNACKSCADELDALVRAASPPFDESSICKCGHHIDQHRYSLVKSEPKGRWDCNHCACEEFRAASPPAPQNPDDDYRGCENLAGSLTLRHLQNVNARRAARWHKGGLTDWSALEWAGAMAGEAGEACNAAKKLKRIEDGIANINLEDGRSLTEKQNAASVVADEVADTIIYGVLLAERVGLDIEEAVRLKFNKKSEEYGFPERLSAGGVRSAGPPQERIGQSADEAMNDETPELARLRIEVADLSHDLKACIERESAGGVAGPQAPPVFTVEVDDDGCSKCSRGKTWAVLGPDDLVSSQSWAEEEDAQHFADKMNRAYELGQISARGDAARVPPATPQGWQPIETAPKGGESLLLWEPGATLRHDGIALTGSWTDLAPATPHPGYQSGWFDDACGRYEIKPSHWMPLPAAPATPQEK